MNDDDFNNILMQLSNRRQNTQNFYNMYNAPHYDVIQVSGRAGAENFRMGPNSSALLLDNTAPIIWFVKTDGGGLLTAKPYAFTPFQEPTPIDLNALQQRIAELEEKLNNVQSNTRVTKQQRNKQPEGTNQTNVPTV